MKKVMQQAMAEPHKPISLFCWCYIFAMGLSWSGITHAGIGDTYFCDMKEWRAMEGGKFVVYKPQRFMFQWDNDQIKFGKGGYFDDSTMPLDPNRNWPSGETFWAGNSWSKVQFTEGRFRYVATSSCKMPCSDIEVQSLVADCSAFSQ